MIENLNSWLPLLAFIGGILGAYVGVHVRMSVLEHRIDTVEHSLRRAHERVDKVCDDRRAPRGILDA